MNDLGHQEPDQDLVARPHGPPRDRRAHVHGPRRPHARAGGRLRRDGRAQAGRVRAHSHLPRSRATGGKGEAQGAVAERATPCARRRAASTRSRARRGSSPISSAGAACWRRATMLGSRPRRRAGHREGAALGRRERRVAPRPSLERRHARRCGGLCRRRPDAEALQAARARPRDRIRKRTCHITIELAQSPALLLPRPRPRPRRRSAHRARRPSRSRPRQLEETVVEETRSRRGRIEEMRGDAEPRPRPWPRNRDHRGDCAPRPQSGSRGFEEETQN